MDEAERWLRKNDPNYTKEQKILRKKQEDRNKYKKLPLK